MRQLQLYFANVTSWSASASDYLKVGTPLANSDVMCVAEHHKQGAALHQQLKTLQKWVGSQCRASC